MYAILITLKIIIFKIMNENINKIEYSCIKKFDVIFCSYTYVNLEFFGQNCVIY